MATPTNPSEHQQLPAIPERLGLTVLLAPFRRFMRQSSSGGILVMAGTLVALVLANIGPTHEMMEHVLHWPIGVQVGENYYSQSLSHLINDGLMAIFFLLVGLEIKRELLAGELRDPRRAALPLAAAVGGMIVPAMLYFALNRGGAGAGGWGIPMATDIAFALGILRLAGRVPAGLLVFLAALAIIDDLGAILVIALFYTSNLSLGSLSVAGVVLLGLIAMNRMGVRHPIPYILMGVVLWIAVLNSGIHATVAGVALAFCIPLKPSIDPDTTIAWTANFATAELKTPNASETIERLHEGVTRGRSPLVAWEHTLVPWVSFVIVPVFAVANAGIVFDRPMLSATSDHIFWGIVVGLVLGKPIGILGASLLAVWSGIARLPNGVTWRSLAGAGVLAGVGFTMAVFIAGLAFGKGEPGRLAIAKAATLAASLIAGVVGFMVIRTTSRR